VAGDAGDRVSFNFADLCGAGSTTGNGRSFSDYDTLNGASSWQNLDQALLDRPITD
jgi:hypothetical protein